VELTSLKNEEVRKEINQKSNPVFVEQLMVSLLKKQEDEMGNLDIENGKIVMI
jgi:hypothetical protein